MRIIHDHSPRSTAYPLTINFLLEKEQYEPYARKILTLNNDPYIGRRIFRIDVVDKSEFASLPLEGANVVVRLVSDPDEKASYAVVTFDFSLPKKKLLPTLKEFINNLYETDLSIAQEVLKTYIDRRDENGCETFSELIELLNVTKPKEYNLISNITSLAAECSIQNHKEEPSIKAHRKDYTLYDRHPLEGLSNEDKEIRHVTCEIYKGIKQQKSYGQKVYHLLKLLGKRYGLTSPWEDAIEDDANETSPEKKELTALSGKDSLEAGEYLIQIVPYKYNIINSTCDFYLQANGIGRILKIPTILGAFVYAMCLILRKHKGVLWRKTLLKDIPADKDEMSPEQKWMESLYEMLFSNNQVKNFREWWKSQIGWERPECHGLNNAITQIKRNIKDLVPKESVDHFTIHTVKDKANKRKVAYYWIDMPKDNIVFEGSKFNELIRIIPESMLKSPQEGIAE